jgi:DNA-binding CsgD family transcriptional regulator
MPEYQAHFHRLDLWKSALVADRSDDLALYHELVPQRTFQNSEIFNDWVKPTLGHEVYWGLGCRLVLGKDRIGLIGIHRPRRHGEMGEEDLNAVRRFLPHLRRAFRLNTLLDLQRIRFGALEQLCEANPGATILVDERGRLTHANRAAWRLLEAGDGLSLCQGGTLSSATRPQTDALRQRIAEVCGIAAAADRNGGVSLRIERKNAGPLLVTVAPVPADRFALPRRLAILCVEDPWGTIAPDARKIALALGVTAAEARLVAALAEGTGLRQAAARLGIAYNTARTQLRSVLEKSGMHGQAELMYRVGRLR